MSEVIPPISPAWKQKKKHHYDMSPNFEALDVLEVVSDNIEHLDLKPITKFKIITAGKYFMRLGKKDDIKKELFKIENYLHNVRTGEWINE